MLVGLFLAPLCLWKNWSNLIMNNTLPRVWLHLIWIRVQHGRILYSLKFSKQVRLIGYLSKRYRASYYSVVMWYLLGLMAKITCSVVMWPTLFKVDAIIDSRNICMILITFSFTSNMSSTIIFQPDKRKACLFYGAYEAVFRLCSFYAYNDYLKIL